MSKKMITLAVAAALAPAAAMADNNVTMYGIIDYGWAMRSGNVSANNQTGGNSNLTPPTQGRTGSLNEFAGGISAGNRIGFKGTEDLGNGLKAIFEIEFGFKGDDTSTTTFNKNRHSWVGLTGNWGTLLGGRVDGARYSFTGKYDPFKNQTVANAASIFGYTSNVGQADRADNAIVYVSPSFSGFSVLTAYTKSLLSQEGSTALAGQNIKTGDTPLWLVAGLYDNGPISATLDYEHLTVTNVGEDSKFGLYVAGASYDFGVAKVSGYYEYTKGSAAAEGIKGSGWLLGVSAPIGPFTVMASYVDGRDKSNIDGTAGNGAGTGDNDCRKYGVGAEYAFSKRTALYSTVAHINADSGSMCAITFAGSSVATPANATASATGAITPASNAAYGRTGFDIGMRHSF